MKKQPRPEWSNNQKILYTYLATRILPLLNANGMWVAPDPAPLTVDQVWDVFEVIAEHDFYDRQFLSTYTKDSGRVTLRAGDLTATKEEDGMPVLYKPPGKDE